jgi:hypothetical protein
MKSSSSTAVACRADGVLPEKIIVCHNMEKLLVSISSVLVDNSEKNSI